MNVFLFRVCVIFVVLVYDKLGVCYGGVIEFEQIQQYSDLNGATPLVTTMAISTIHCAALCHDNPQCNSFSIDCSIVHYTATSGECHLYNDYVTSPPDLTPSHLCYVQRKIAGVNWVLGTTLSPTTSVTTAVTTTISPPATTTLSTTSAVFPTTVNLSPLTTTSLSPTTSVTTTTTTTTPVQTTTTTSAPTTTTTTPVPTTTTTPVPTTTTATPVPTTTTTTPIPTTTTTTPIPTTTTTTPVPTSTTTPIPTTTTTTPIPTTTTTVTTTSAASSIRGIVNGDFRLCSGSSGRDFVVMRDTGVYVYEDIASLSTAPCTGPVPLSTMFPGYENLPPASNIECVLLFQSQVEMYAAGYVYVWQNQGGSFAKHLSSRTSYSTHLGSTASAMIGSKPIKWCALRSKQNVERHFNFDDGSYVLLDSQAGAFSYIKTSVIRHNNFNLIPWSDVPDDVIAGCGYTSQQNENFVLIDSALTVYSYALVHSPDNNNPTKIVTSQGTLAV